jgi:mannonate dehydratase
MKPRSLPLLEESFRCFGPADPVPLPYLRHAGATAGLRWTAVESVPVHEDIKTGSGDLDGLLAAAR